MSTVAFGALQTRRLKSPSGTSKTDKPPALNSYIDILAALVPAEVLAIHALVIASVVHTDADGKLTITDAGTLRWAFWLLLALTVGLFIVGRRPSVAAATAPGQPKSAPSSLRAKNLEWQDLIRLIIPAGAFVCWTMLEPTSVWNAVVPGMSSGTRLLIPLVGATFLAAVTKGLVSHSDKKLSPQQQAEASELAPAAHKPAAPENPGAAKPAPDPEPKTPGPAPDPKTPALQSPSLTTVPDGTPADSVPKWVYGPS